jgi:hypothetical protein
MTLCGLFLTVGFAAQAGLEKATETERPPLRAPLANIPMELGDWAGRDVSVDPRILKESQTDEYINRIYEDRKDPSRRLWLWINYSSHGLNLRHSPKICLPSGGWTEIESESRMIPVRYGDGKTIRIMRLGYAQGELVQSIGFWYYIFGEGGLEHYVRNLPITSRSSHGRTTRGSGMTVEVFCPGEIDPDGSALADFARPLIEALGPIMPENRAEYYIP